MGACFNTKQFPAILSIPGLKKAYASLVEDLNVQYGSDPYNGTFTTCGDGQLDVRDDLTFENWREADKWLSDNHCKWGRALAVRYKKTESITVKEPTFNGNPASQMSFASNKSYAVHYYGKSADGVKFNKDNPNIITADQLTEKQAIVLRAAVAKLLDCERELDLHTQALHKIGVEIYEEGDLSFTLQDIKKHRKARERLKKKLGPLGEKLRAIDERYSKKLYKIKEGPKEVLWLVGGWCAE